MIAKRQTPILNVSDIQQTFAWFEKLARGCRSGWMMSTPSTSDVSSKAYLIYLWDEKSMREKG
jgi:hypothetical protein